MELLPELFSFLPILDLSAHSLPECGEQKALEERKNHLHVNNRLRSGFHHPNVGPAAQGL